MNPKNSSSGGRKAERSKQSARDCRIRKKLRYQYLEELVNCREQAVFALRKELEQLKAWCIKIDRGEIPSEFVSYVTDLQKRLVDLNILSVVPADSGTISSSEATQPQVAHTDLNMLSAANSSQPVDHSQSLSHLQSAEPVASTSTLIEGSPESALTLSLEDAATLLSIFATENLIELPAGVCEQEFEGHGINENDDNLDLDNDFDLANI